MVILDTNIIIDHLRQKPGTKTLLAKINDLEGKDYLAISAITIQELFEGKSTKDQQKTTELLAIISPLTIFDYNLEIAQTAGKIARDLKEPIEFADSAIAATCIYNNCQLLTLNKKHFQNILELEFYQKDL